MFRPELCLPDTFIDQGAITRAGGSAANVARSLAVGFGVSVGLVREECSVGLVKINAVMDMLQRNAEQEGKENPAC